MHPRRRATAMAVGAAMLVVAACTPDPGDEATGPEPTGTTAPEVAARIADDCAPDPDAGSRVPATWPGPPLVVEAGGAPLVFDLADAIDAPCLTLADTYSAAFEVPIPGLGTLEVVEGTTVSFAPPDAPADLDAPDHFWWGQDRIRACVNLGNDRLGCTNIDIDVIRSEVLTIAEHLGAGTLPTLTTAWVRSGMQDEGLSPSGIARLQDGYAGAWAMRLLIDLRPTDTLPPLVAAACEAAGVEPTELLGRADELIERLGPLADLSGVELAATLGREPDPNLSATNNEVLRELSDWVECAT